MTVAIADSGPLLNRLGQVLAGDQRNPSGGTLLHASIGSGWISISIFEDRGKDVLYVDPDYDLFQNTLYDLWKLEEEGKRWEELDYLILGGKFDAAFFYPEEIDPEEEPLDRRDRIVKRYFGDKPIVYPPWPFEDQESFEL
jgi:hypothetical protein